MDEKFEVYADVTGPTSWGQVMAVLCSAVIEVAKPGFTIETVTMEPGMGSGGEPIVIVRATAVGEAK